MVQQHELNLFRKPISGRYVAVAFHEHALDHEHRDLLMQPNVEHQGRVPCMRLFFEFLGCLACIKWIYTT